MHIDRFHAASSTPMSSARHLTHSLIAFIGIVAALASGRMAAAQSPTFGPLMAQNGFPESYSDGHGLDLALCLADPNMCMLLQSVADPVDGLAFPLNYNGTFPSESFYWAATATMDTNNGGQALLVLALEASFTSGLVLPGEQTTFARMRLRVDNLQVGPIYTITTPYGSFPAFASRTGRRGINFTQDFGLVPGDFSLALQSNMFPFLRWDGGLPIVDGQGHRFIGDPNIPHRVTGSPTGNNVFRIDGPNIGGPGINTISTDLFLVAGVEHVPAPVAAFRANVTTGTAPMPVAFTSLSTGAIGTYNWTFGDGGSARSRNPAHVYTVPGTYTVGLTVTGPGGSASTSQVGLVHVAPPPPLLTLSRNDGAGQRLRLRIARSTPDAKLVVLGSPSKGTAPFRAGRCAMSTSLAQPAVYLAKISGASGGSVEAEFRVPLGLAGQTWFFQVLDPNSCLASNVLPVQF